MQSPTTRVSFPTAIARVATAALIALVSAACSGGDEPAADGGSGGGDACDPGFGTLVVCVYDDATSTTPLAGAEVTIRRDAMDIPWIIRAGDDGCTDETVDVGAWEMSAKNAAGDCVTSFEPIEVRGCEINALDVYVIAFCTDG
jgi:hypothetical protein